MGTVWILVWFLAIGLAAVSSSLMSHICECGSRDKIMLDSQEEINKTVFEHISGQPVEDE